MPYIWTEPELVVEQSGVSIYRAYEGQVWDTPSQYHYSTSMHEGDGMEFDIRDLPEYRVLKLVITVGDGDDHALILRVAIASGTLTEKGIVREPHKDAAANKVEPLGVEDWDLRGRSELGGLSAEEGVALVAAADAMGGGQAAVVEVLGGVVIGVYGLPEGWAYHLLDWDNVKGE